LNDDYKEKMYTSAYYKILSCLDDGVPKFANIFNYLTIITLTIGSHIIYEIQILLSIWIYDISVSR